MAIVNQFTDKKVLIIDDLVGMRTQLQLSLTHCGFEKLHVVSNIKDAISRIQSGKYEIILCDYVLGDSTNGQQFLEYLRGKHLINFDTIFIMITAERSYEKVVAAADCEPDDYVVKPFTADQLLGRLMKLMDRRERFAAVNRARDARAWRKVVAECDAIIAAQDKYLTEATKIKGEALLAGGNAVEAETLYAEMLAVRPLPWARLGLAKATAMLGRKDEAATIARGIIAENGEFLGAYDFLGGVLVAAGKKDEALQVLQTAREISPGTLARVRNIGSLAVDAGQYEITEQVLREALNKNKYSAVREAQDYALLSRALSAQGKADEALAVLKETTFKDAASNMLLAASESIAHCAAGNNELAEAALAKVFDASHGNLPPNIAAAVADACFMLGKNDKAMELLKQVVQDNPDDALLHAKARAVLSVSGKGEEEAAAIVDACMREIFQINNDGVRKAEAGHFGEAIPLLRDAADRLPNNLQIVGNTALAMALDMMRNGYSVLKMNECMRYRQMVADKSSDHPRLAQVDTVLKQVKKS